LAFSASARPGASFFAKLGVLIIPGFLSPAECARIIDEMRTVPQRDASLSVRDRPDGVIDTRQRKGARADVDAGTIGSLVNRFVGVKPEIETFFRSSFAESVETPKCLVYRPGDFFIAHRDVKASDDDIRSPLIRARRINLIVNLNRESESAGPGEYSGAALTLYGLIDEPRWRTYGFPVTSEPGALVAFRADILHEVTPIVAGERYCIVSRMLDPSFRQPPAEPGPGAPPR
jgi:SM-20-related protein